MNFNCYIRFAAELPCYIFVVNISNVIEAKSILSEEAIVGVNIQSVDLAILQVGMHLDHHYLGIRMVTHFDHPCVEPTVVKASNLCTEIQP